MLVAHSQVVRQMGHVVCSQRFTHLTGVPNPGDFTPIWACTALLSLNSQSCWGVLFHLIEMRLRHQLVRCLCRAASAAYGQPTAAAPLTSKAALQLALLYKQPPCTPWHQLRLHHSAAAAEPTGSSKQRPQTLEEHEQACWSCKHHYQRGGLVCQSCDTIQPPDSSLNYFELLGW